MKRRAMIAPQSPGNPTLVKNHSDDVSQMPVRIATRPPPSTGSAQPGQPVDPQGQELRRQGAEEGAAEDAVDHDAGVGVPPAERPQAVVGDGQHEQERRRPGPAVGVGDPARRRADAGQPAVHPRRRDGLGDGQHERRRSSATPSSTAASGTRSGRSARPSGRGPWRRRRGRPRPPRRSPAATSSGTMPRPPRRRRDRRRIVGHAGVAIRSACEHADGRRLESGWRCAGDRPGGRSAVVVLLVVTEEVQEHPLLADRLAVPADRPSCAAAG